MAGDLRSRRPATGRADAAEANRWDRTELEYLGRLVARVVNQYKVDPARVVVYGQGSGGAMAWLLGLSGRSVIRGLADIRCTAAAADTRAGKRAEPAAGNLRGDFRRQRGRQFPRRKGCRSVPMPATR